MRLKRTSNLLKFGLIALLFVSVDVCLAQSDRGSITGSLADPTGNVIPAAPVTATNEATGVQSRTVTTGDGYYTIPSLPAGSYSLTVQAPGFQKLIRNGITVSVDAAIRVDLVLTVGATSATVTVTEDAPLLKTENPENDIVVTSNDINELPINMAGVDSRDPTTGSPAIRRTRARYHQRRRLERHSYQWIARKHFSRNPRRPGFRQRIEPARFRRRAAIRRGSPGICPGAG